ncbi:MAG: type II CRISPR RNA-guided endonuclease Cas9 [Olsenella sp.]|jgi:CRISPR-associated endonuclease Csn1|nr:type II CRISPR RNA-guided endonuclease Cas9 [Olsenella sp.]
MAEPYLVLGLDPGISSCGFALLDMNNHKILEMGSHLFDAPQEDKTKVSLAVGRRNARSARRNNLRTKNRQKHCMELLKEAGLVPQEATKQWFQSTKGDRPLLELRFAGLERLLTNREFAQVLYALSARRGYIPHGEGRISKISDMDTSGSSDAETGKVLKAIDENKEIMAQGHFRTVGEMLYSKGESRNKGGSYEHCVLNSQIEDEVHVIFQSQRAHQNPVATQELEDAYVKNLTWEKRTLDHDARVYALVGKCSYFPNENRAARADLSSELCNAYERLKHLHIVNADGDETSLAPEQVEAYIAILFSPEPLKGSKGKVTYARIRKDLDLSAHLFFKGVDPEDEKDHEPYTPKAWRAMRKVLSTELMERLRNDRALADAVGEALTYASSEDSLIYQLDDLNLSDDERNQILGLPFSGKIFKGYGSRSLKALGMLVDAFEEPEVTTLAEAEESSGLLGLRMSDNGTRYPLLPPYSTYDKENRNPVVLRAMSRMRRIVNAIIRIYGVPDEIHVELGRDLKRSKHEKDLINKRNRENERKNTLWRSQIAEAQGTEPEEVRPKLLKKIALWEEQDNFDIYTGHKIEFDRMISDDKYCEIDHVLPYSRTCDDSRNNKVLVLAKSNQDKRERTPYEWMTQDAQKGAPGWDEYQARVIANHHISPRKRRYLLNNNLGPDQERDFLSRNLNDDRYMSRAVKSYLEDTLIFPEDGRVKHVIAVAGGATGSLRHVWGLNFGANNTKDRSDNRHHAVDACVIAACSEATVQAVAKAHKLGAETYKHMREDRLKDTQPWPTFADEVVARREFVIPTRMVSHGVTGRAFEDTNYRFDGLTNDTKKLGMLYGNGKSVKKGNFVIGDDGNAHLVDGMAFLRLWLDPTAKKGKGKWYAEPVYYADIPAIKNGTYVPRAAKAHVARVAWEPVPKSALASSPVVVFSGDVIKVGSSIARYSKFHIGAAALILQDLRTGEEITKFPTLGKWSNELVPTVVNEDCLGHCYKGLVPSSLES